MPQEIVTMSLLRYDSFSARWWAFVQMGWGPGRFRSVPGLRHVRMLGSGAGNGFSIWPNFGVYGWLGVWEDEAAARRFFAENDWWRSAGRCVSERYTVFLRTCQVHGQWNGVTPFTPTVPFEKSAMVAVITRATIRPRHIPFFWRQVPRVSASVKDRPGELLSVGVGEWPLFMQATFSLWTSAQAMMDYAYQSQFHRDIIRQTRERGWYKEELFARFAPFASE
ncbi:MAG: hypothetical protein KDC54_01980, partial [Lewinella sp.]|nr:hypothetical protein [Lewinella sp.]